MQFIARSKWFTNRVRSAKCLDLWSCGHGLGFLDLPYGPAFTKTGHGCDFTLKDETEITVGNRPLHSQRGGGV
jgi:hypothetical protein